MPTLNLTQRELEVLHSYTRSSLEGDDSYDGFRENIVSVCEKMEALEHSTIGADDTSEMGE